MRCVDKDTGVLGSNDRLDDRRKVIDIREGFDAKEDIVE